MPSPHSTNSPSLENLANGDKNSESYQLLNKRAEGSATGSEIQLHYLGRKRTFEEDVRYHITGRHVRLRNICLVMALAVSIGLACWFSKQDWNPASKDGFLWPHKKEMKPKGSRAPFSKLHPVDDLGLFDYTRPESSSPSRPVTEGIQNVKNYPTNAWYQSLLMPGGEPSVIHRAYAIPYVVDAAGPIPGLRLHPNHIDASSFVVQLYVIEEYGLTLGAATDAAAPVSAKHAKTAKKLSGQYNVTHLNSLGLTLKWVSDNGALKCMDTRAFEWSYLTHSTFIRTRSLCTLPSPKVCRTLPCDTKAFFKLETRARPFYPLW